MSATANSTTPSYWFTQVGTPLLLLACLLVALVARDVELDRRGFWFDEAYTWRMGQNTESQIVDRLRFDNNPPLYYLVVRYWGVLADESPEALRSLSVAAGLATVLGTFLFARALLTGPLGGPSRVSAREVAWVPLLSAAFVAMNPLLVRYGCEARMYALGAALAVFSGWALVRALDPEHPRWGRWLLFAAITSVFAYVHTFALLTIAAEAAFVGWWLLERAGGGPQRVVRQPAFRSAMLAFLLVALAFAPWIPTLLDQLRNSGTREWIPQLYGYRDLYPLAYKLFISPEGPQSEYGPVRVGIVAALFLVVAAWRGRWVEGVLLTLGLAPILGAAVLSLLGTQVFLYRYFIFGQPFLLAIIAVAIARLRSPALFALAAVTALSIHGYWCHDFWRQQALDKHPGYRGAADYIHKLGAPEQMVICSDGRTFFPIRFHLKGRPNVFSVYPENGEVYGKAAVVNEREDFRPSEELVRSARGNVWVVHQEWGGRVIDPVSVPPTWREVSRTQFPEAFGMETVILIQYSVTQK